MVAAMLLAERISRSQIDPGCMSVSGLGITEDSASIVIYTETTSIFPPTIEVCDIHDGRDDHLCTYFGMKTSTVDQPWRRRRCPRTSHGMCFGEYWPMNPSSTGNVFVPNSRSSTAPR